MSYRLADFQADTVTRTYEAYRNGAKNVMLVLPTGAGKTVIMGSIAHQYAGFGVSIAHRGVLVGQMSLALGREGVRHDIIAPDGVIRTIVGMHMKELGGKSFYDARAKWKVASVDTLVQRRKDLPASWTKQVGMAQIDEGHHVLRDNKWGRALSIFDNAYGLLPTASPRRADGKGLGRNSDGLVDAMVEGPGMRWLIDNGFLTDYIIRGINPSDLDLDGVQITASGEFQYEEVRKRVKASTKIVGDVVETYLEFARGKKGITFAVDVEHANDIAKAFIARGVPAIVVTAETSESDRREIMQRFMYGDLMQLVNVDLFGEGVDVPAVEVVSMARPTASYSLYLQQFGRALRLLVSPILRAAWHTYTPAQRKQFIAESSKPYAQIIDHVGNLIRHYGPPDWQSEPWSLEPRSRSNKAADAIPLRACANPLCLQPFLRIETCCPRCGWTPPIPADRSRPELVDGDVILYTQELMQQLFKKQQAIDSSFVPTPPGATPVIVASCHKRHRDNQESQARLRAMMQLALPPGVDDRVANKRFFFNYGVDTLTAKGLPSAQADELCHKIKQRIFEQ